MSKRLVILFCALFVFAAAVPAFAAVQNIKVSGDILARYIARNNFDLTKGGTDAEDNKDAINVFNSVVRLRVDADLTDNVGATIRLINERNWEENDSANSDIDLDLAYVTLKEFLYSPLSFTIGRQELHFGNDMIIGDGVGNPNRNAVSGGIGTNQTTNYIEASGYGSVNGDLAYRKAFDSIRATLNYDPLVIDVVYALIDHENITGSETNDWINLYGINAGYQFSDKWNTLAEGYFWSKDDSSAKYLGSAAADKLDSVHTIGGRISTMPNSKLNIQQEIAYQFGTKLSPATSVGTGAIVERDRSAWAAQTVVMATPGWKYEPTFGLIYSYFSGDANRDSSGLSANAGKTFHAWDPMFENQINGHIINALFPQSNAHNFDLMAKMSPVEDVWVQLDYVYLMMAKASSITGEMIMNDYDADGMSFLAGDRELGHEVDVNIVYNYTEDVQFGLLAGWFMPGRAFDKSNDGEKARETATEAIASCKVSF
ncbi:MAG: alginate export family protein [Candidatus Omnitrophica bacterium]|nr:alginate export family protein [Candidatus Omnitrophota bacterium]